MPMRDLTVAEEDANRFLQQKGIVSTLLHVTETGLAKSILDATRQVRKLFVDVGLHDYDKQGQGQENKVIIQGKFISHDQIMQTKVSLYRPNTKQGDPRIWPSGLNNHAKPSDILAVFVMGQECCFVNLTKIGSQKANFNEDNSLLCLLLRDNFQVFNPAAGELLNKLGQIANKGPIRSVCEGTTAIGRSLETALGIRINSSQAPDYKGIEIKSFRDAIHNSRGTRITLFACVPDWEISTLKGSHEILRNFGYQRKEEFKLYCTVGIGKPNSQGLFLSLDEAEGLLREKSNNKKFPDVAAWRLERLEQKLCSKHKETFWVNAESLFLKGNEYFRIKSITHTRGPNVFQLERMLLRNNINVDHLIKQKNLGKVTEKGPLFKINRDFLPDLFLGRPKIYKFDH